VRRPIKRWMISVPGYNPTVPCRGTGRAKWVCRRRINCSRRRRRCRCDGVECVEVVAVVCIAVSSMFGARRSVMTMRGGWMLSCKHAVWSRRYALARQISRPMPQRELEVEGFKLASRNDDSVVTTKRSLVRAAVESVGDVEDQRTGASAYFMYNGQGDRSTGLRGQTPSGVVVG
jgi:hypothetical protein